jgi:hypothetical protein
MHLLVVPKQITVEYCFRKSVYSNGIGFPLLSIAQDNFPYHVGACDVHPINYETWNSNSLLKSIVIAKRQQNKPVYLYLQRLCEVC